RVVDGEQPRVDRDLRALDLEGDLHEPLRARVEPGLVVGLEPLLGGVAREGGAVDEVEVGGDLEVAGEGARERLGDAAGVGHAAAVEGVGRGDLDQGDVPLRVDLDGAARHGGGRRCGRTGGERQGGEEGGQQEGEQLHAGDTSNWR